MMLTSASIKARARELGFDLCGIAPVDDFPELSFLREWLERGYAGDMAWMARSADRRADVREVVPGARSVIVTGTIYNTVTGTTRHPAGSVARHPAHGHEAGPAEGGSVARPLTCSDGANPAGVPRTAAAEPTRREDDPTTTAVISRYAWGDDYHDVLRARLDSLLSWMRTESSQPFEARAYVDTGPVQERVYAQYAGLGWIGKNTCLISAEAGSWLFLSELITTLSLEPDTQGLEQCGSCTRCLDACPTGALVEPGVLDSNRCLSYLTIELRTSIPEEHRRAIGSHVYGCDICQEVCPYNQPPARSDDPAWQARPGLDLPLLVELWQHSDAAMRRMLKGSAMTRAKLTGLRRNLAVAIGNSGDPAAVAVLAERSNERPSAEDPMVREHVRWAQSNVRRSTETADPETPAT
jgi:epoxyqueuosine reductase